MNYLLNLVLKSTFTLISHRCTDKYLLSVAICASVAIFKSPTCRTLQKIGDLVRSV